MQPIKATDTNTAGHLFSHKFDTISVVIFHFSPATSKVELIFYELVSLRTMTLRSIIGVIVARATVRKIIHCSYMSQMSDFIG